MARRGRRDVYAVPSSPLASAAVVAAAVDAATAEDTKGAA